MIGIFLFFYGSQATSPIVIRKSVKAEIFRGTRSFTIFTGKEVSRKASKGAKKIAILCAFASFA